MGPDPRDARLHPPELTARFVLRSRLGKGAAGVVYRAVTREGGRRVVLKLVALEGGLGAEVRGRFEAEARLLARMNHRHVLAVLESGILPGVAYLAYPDEGGLSLDVWLAARFPRPARVPHPVALRLLDELLQGLAHVHAQGVVHRDVKPANVLVAADGSTRIFDFGLARDLGDPERLTRTETLVGTPLYMGPDQVRGLEPDPRDDLYSVGALAYELLAGTSPFAGGTLSQVLQRQLALVPPPLVEAVPGTDPALSALVADLLAKRRADRPPDAGAARERLAPLLVRDGTGTWDAEDARTYQDLMARRASGAARVPGRLPGAARLAGAVAVVAAVAWAAGAARFGPGGREPVGDGPRLPAPAAFRPDDVFVRGLFDEVERLKPHQTELLADPLATDRLLERLPSLARFFEWVASGGFAPELEGATRLGLKTVDRAMEERGLPPLLGAYLDGPGEADPGRAPWAELIHRLGRRAIGQVEAVAATLLGPPAGDGPPHPALANLGPLVADLRRFGSFHEANGMRMESVAERFWLAGPVERAAWCRWTQEGSRALQRAVWVAMRSLRTEPAAEEEALAAACFALDEANSLVYSAWARLPLETLLGGRPATPREHRLAASLAARMEESERDPTRRTALLEAARESYRICLDGPAPATPHGGPLAAQAFWGLERCLRKLGRPVEPAELFRRHVLGRIDESIGVVRDIAASLPTHGGRLNTGPQGVGELARMIVEVSKTYPAVLPPGDRERAILLERAAEASR